MSPVSKKVLGRLRSVTLVYDWSAGKLLLFIAVKVRSKL